MAYGLASGGGLGYAPQAPGTVGSLVGVGLFWWWGRSVWLGVGVCLLSTLIGIWAAGRVERASGKEDPSLIIIDEIAGQFVALWLAWALTDMPGIEDSTPWLFFLFIGFGLFRFFDIIKPFPIRRLEKLGRGVGVMADDVMAGIYAGILLHLIVRWGIL